jgi:formate hydrogenlyase transcriptional activator
LDWTAQQIRQVRLRDLTGLSDLLGGRDVPEGAPLESQPFNIKVEKLHQRRDGTSIWLWIIVSMVPRTSPSDSCQLVLVEDITDWKRAEAALRQNEVQLRHELARERSLLSFLLDLNSTWTTSLEVRETPATSKEPADEVFHLDEPTAEQGPDEVIGWSGGLKRMVKQVETVAATDAAVLLLGETGTGKERIARTIHSMSARRNHPLIMVNCASIPPGLLESELFGHEKGAFTGAVNRGIGRCELSDQGTLFMDEVADIPAELQPKLLRVLQEQEFERLGGTRTIRVNFRLIAATNRNLAQMVADDRFRSDLYYRLKVFPIAVPPLRDRKDDIPLLMWHFVEKYGRGMSKRIKKIRREDMDALMRYTWPGNVRELQNVIEHSVILSTDAVLHLCPLEDTKKLTADATIRRNQTLQEAEREHILQALRNSAWVIGGPYGAAARLGVRRTTLLYKMRRLGISRPNTLT